MNEFRPLQENAVSNRISSYNNKKCSQPTILLFITALEKRSLHFHFVLSLNYKQCSSFSPRSPLNCHLTVWKANRRRAEIPRFREKGLLGHIWWNHFRSTTLGLKFTLIWYNICLHRFLGSLCALIIWGVFHLSVYYTSEIRHHN